MNDLQQRIAELPAAKQKLLLRKLKQRRTRRESAIEPSPLRATGGPYPLSFSQERQWFLDQLEPGTPAYNIPTVLHLGGELSIAALALSLREIVRRHESLRTTFPVAEGKAVQKVLPRLELPLPLVDLSALDAEDCRRIGTRLAARESAHSFDLERGPLLRTTLLRLIGGEHRLIAVMHHIISDGWSLGVMHREVAQLYAAFRAGRPSPLPELALQYPDFACWQRRWLQGEELERQISYWRRQLTGLGVLELPTDHPRPAIQTFRGGGVSVVIGGELLAGLRGLAEEEGASPYMVLLAGVKALLYRYTRQSDLSVGTFIANRNRAELENLIGFFVNNLALRTDLSGRPGMRELVRRVRRTTLDAYAHQDVPFEKLLEVLQPERDMSRPSLFQVMCVLQNMPQPRPPAGDLTVREEVFDGGRANFDLSWWIQERPDDLLCRFEYNADLFTRATAVRMAEHFKRLLEGAISDPERSLAALPLLSAEERRQLLVEWNRTDLKLPWKGGVHRLFAHRARLDPQAPAVAGDGAVVSYGELEARANRLGRYLRRLGVGPEVRVAISIGDEPERIVAVVAVLKAGGAFLPLDPDYGGERLGFMIADAGARVLLTTRRLSEELVGLLPAASAAARCRVVQLDAEGAAVDRESAADPEVAVVAENLAYVVYTSGSTGRPKGVMVSHGALDNACRAWEERYRLANDARRHLQMASFSFDVFVGDLVRALCSGGCLVLCPRELLLEPQRLHELMVRQRVDAGEFVPAVVRSQLDYLERSGRTDEALGFMRLLVVGSDTWYARELAAVERQVGPGSRVISSYGVAEATIDSTCFEPASLEPGDALRALDGDRSVPIGRPFANTRLYLLDPDLEPVPLGVPGELMIGGAGLARGYLERRGLSAERFLPNPFAAELGDGEGGRLYRTGDLARYLPNGQLEFLGRADHQVKVRGFRIEPGEIEATLEEDPRLRRAVVVARRPAAGTAGDQRLVAYFLVEPGAAAPRAGELRELVAGRLPEYMVPSAFVILDQLPLTPNGKVDRRALPDPDWSRPELRGGFVAPRTPEEEQMAGIWAQVLRVEQVGRDDNFFDLGGHSLLATQLVSRVRRAFGVELALRALFESPTVAGLTRRLAAQRGKDLGPAPPPIVALPRSGEGGREAPLSFAQQRLWFLDRLVPGSPFYNIHLAVRLVGPLDPALLKAALNEVVRRHETLRTTFTEDRGRPRQVIAERCAVALPRIDLIALRAAHRRAVTRRLARAEARRSFDLGRGPLLRVLLLAAGAGAAAQAQHVCLLTMHHIISDAWSMGVFFAEMAALYTALGNASRAGAGAALPELGIQYADFAHWQQRWLSGPVLEAQLDYWRRQLEGAPEVLDLPTDRPRPSMQSFRGRRWPIFLPPSLAGALRALADAAGATPFMAVLAAFQALLARHSGQDDVVVGSPIANRNREEIEPLIGFFVNTLVLRADLSGAPTYRGLLDRVREICLGAYAHQDLPFERLVEELRPERELNRSPLFQVVFVFQNAPLPATATATDFTIGSIEQNDGTAKFDLVLELNEASSGGLAGDFEYATDLFDRTTIARMARHFANLLQAAVDDPERAVSALPFFAPGERNQLLIEWNDTPAEYPAGVSIHQQIEARVDLCPEVVAVVCGRTPQRLLSYRELDRRANRLAHHLRWLGVGPEVVVGLYLERSSEMVVATLAVLKAGGAYLPLDPGYPAERLSFMLDDAGARVLVTVEGLAAAFPELAGAVERTVILDREAGVVAGRGCDRPAAGTAGHNLAYVIYTSGSTGRPKGVCCFHAGVLNLLADFDARQPIAPGDGCSWWTSPSFDASVYEALSPLLAGGTLHLVPEPIRPLGDRFVEWLSERRIRSAYVPPFMLRDLAARVRGLVLRRLFVGVEPIAESLLNAIREGVGGLRIINGYGPTESTVCCALYNVPGAAGAPAERNTPIGRPPRNTRVRLLDRRLRPVPAGVPGELHAGGVGVARGYLGRPALTAERFIPDPFAGTGDAEPGARLYRTGDLVRYRPDGNLEFLGRIDHQVKIRGFRVELGEIEVLLSEHPAVAEAVVVAREEAPALGQAVKILVAYAVPSPGSEVPDAVELRSFLAAQLPEYMVPAAVVVLEALPQTASGKTDRAALGRRPLPARERTAAGDGERPRTPVEEILAGIWAEVLGCERVGLDADFFALGGHSLLATQLVSRLRHAFAVELPLRRLFETPTVAGLARAVAELRQAARGLELPPPRPLPRAGDLPLSFAQQRLWFIDQMDPGNPAYNLALPVHLSGRLDLAALAGSLDAVRRRHEVLRTTFATRGGKPVQVIADESAEGMAVVDLRALPEAAREPEALRLARDDAARPFDLARGPLLRTAVLRLAENDCVFLLTMHHIVTDGWSMEVFLREVVTLYGVAVRGEPSPLPELAIQYADFAGWQRQWLEEKVFTAQMETWKNRLQPPLAVVELPADRPRPALRTYRGSTRGISLPDSLATALGELARRRGATGFMVSLAAFLVLLRRITGENDLPVGTPIANRNLAEIEGLIGFFVNTLVMRGDLSGDPDFHSLLARVREVALEAYENQDLPFELLVEALDPDRDLSRPPLFQVMFVHQAPSRLRAPSDSELSVSTLALAGTVAKFDLTLFVADSGAGLSAALEYNTDLFDPSTATRLLDQYRRLLEGVAAAPERRISELALLAPGERHQLLGEWNDTAVAFGPERCLHQLVETRVAAWPEAIAVAQGDERVSYAELNRRANQLAHYLRSRAAGAGAPELLVGICLDRSVEMVVGVLGILKAGGAYLPLDPTYPEQRLTYMLEDSRAAILLTREGLADRLRPQSPACAIVRVDADRAAVGRFSAANPVSGGTTANLAYTIYTSGSTGRPKGVMVSHRGVVNYLRWCVGAYDLATANGVPLHSSIAFDMSVTSVLGPLLSGDTVVLVADDESGEALATALDGAPDFSLAKLTPSHLEILALTLPPESAAGAARALILGGEALSWGKALAFWRRNAPGTRLINEYGPTETVVGCCVYELSPEARPQGSVPIGRPIANLRVLLLDRDGVPVPIGVAGELCVAGAGLARGYLGRPRLTAERFVPNPFADAPGERLYRTGDEARWRPDGNLEYLGRLDFQVKVRGFRIELGEIETVLAACPGIRESVVVLRDTGRLAGDRELVAYLVGEAVDVHELRVSLSRRLPPSMVPAAYGLLDALPRLPNGKVDRAALVRRAPDRPRPELTGEYVAPRTALEEVLAGMWAELLRIDEVGVHANFFELGGHSLLATQLLSWVRDSFDAEVPLRLVFEQPTVAGLAAALLADPAERPRVEKTAELLLELSEVEE